MKVLKRRAFAKWQSREKLPDAVLCSAVEEICEGIKNGVRKVNIDTDIRLAMTGAIRRFLAENPGKFDPREYNKPAREAAKKICVARYQEFGTAGNASKIKPIALDEIAAAYAAGKLAQQVK